MVNERKMEGSLNERPLFPFHKSRVLGGRALSYFN